MDEKSIEAFPALPLRAQEEILVPRCVMCWSVIMDKRRTKTCCPKCARKLATWRAAQDRAKDPERYNAAQRRHYAVHKELYQEKSREYNQWLREQSDEVRQALRDKRKKP